MDTANRDEDTQGSADETSEDPPSEKAKKRKLIDFLTESQDESD